MLRWISILTPCLEGVPSGSATSHLQQNAKLFAVSRVKYAGQLHSTLEALRSAELNIALHVLGESGDTQFWMDDAPLPLSYRCSRICLYGVRIENPPVYVVLTVITHPKECAGRRRSGLNVFFTRTVRGFWCDLLLVLVQDPCPCAFAR